MAIDWDALVLAPAMAIFGEGQPSQPDQWPLFQPKGGAAFRLADAVFDAAYRRVEDLGDGTTSTSEHPVLGVRDALFAQPGRRMAKQGDRLTMASGKRYAVADVQSDGHGHSLLILIEAA